jgi:hypothetical protein
MLRHLAIPCNHPIGFDAWPAMPSTYSGIRRLITSINQAVNGDSQQATDAENQTWSNL